MSCPQRMSDFVNRFSPSVEMVCFPSFILLMCCITLAVFHMLNYLARMTKKKKKERRLKLLKLEIRIGALLPILQKFEGL